MTAPSIRAALTRKLLVVLTVVAIATNTALYFYLREELIEQYDAALFTEARALGSIWQSVGDGARASARMTKLFPQLHFGHKDGDVLKIVRKDGTTRLNVPATSSTGLQRQGSETSEAQREAYDLLLPDGRSGRAAEVTIEKSFSDARNSPSEKHVLMLAEDRAELDETLTHLMLGMVVIGGGLLAASIWLVVNAVRVGLRPLSEFSESVGRLDAETLGYRFPIEGLAEELRPISSRLNDTLGRLDASFKRERRFTSDVAHELRTPLAELRSMVEVATKWPPTSEELPHLHASILSVVQRMTTVVQNLLKLTRPTHSQLTATPDEIELVQQVKTAWSSHASTAAQRRVGFRFDGSSEQIVRSDRAILSSLLDNVLANAAAYAAADSVITCAISGGDEAHGVALRLTNATTDLRAADLEVFEQPFWRKDPARSDGDHSGLGLALVREYSNVLGIVCRYSMSASNELTVELIWPANGPLARNANSVDEPAQSAS